MTLSCDLCTLLKLFNMFERQGASSGKESFNTDSQSQKRGSMITPISKHFTEKGHAILPAGMVFPKI